MNKKDIITKAEQYSKDEASQRAYIAGFQDVCNIILKKINSCHMAEFVIEMEELSKVAYVDFWE